MIDILIIVVFFSLLNLFLPMIFSLHKVPFKDFTYIGGDVSGKTELSKRLALSADNLKETLPLFLALSIFFFITSMGMVSNEWKYIYKKVILLSYLIFLYSSKCAVFIYTKVNKTDEKSQIARDNSSPKIEPKIDFNNLKNQPVQNYSGQAVDTNVVEQKEIDLKEKVIKSNEGLD